MALKDKERDRLLLDLLECVSLVAETLSDRNSEFIKGRLEHHKSKFPPEDEYDTLTNVSMFDVGDFVVVRSHFDVFRGAIIEHIDITEGNSVVPGYRVKSLANPRDIRPIKQSEVSKRIESTLPPPAPIRDITSIPAPPLTPEINMTSIASAPPPTTSTNER